MSGKRLKPNKSASSRSTQQGLLSSSTPQPIQHELRVEYSGPLPPTEELRGYNEISAGAADKIIDAFIRQSDHRRTMESRALDANIRQSWVGLWLGFIALVIIVIAFFVLTLELRTPAIALGIAGGLAGIVGVFVYGTSGQRRERLRKTQILAGED